MHFFFRHNFSAGGQHQEPQHRLAVEPNQRPPQDVGRGDVQGRPRGHLHGLDDANLQLPGTGDQHVDQDPVAEEVAQL